MLVAAEPTRDCALMEFRLTHDNISESLDYFDSIVYRIENKDFEIRRVPEPRICMECDFRTYCTQQGDIRLKIDHLKNSRN